MKSSRLLAAVFALIAVFLTACNGGSDSESATPTTAPGGEPTATAAAPSEDALGLPVRPAAEAVVPGEGEVTLTWWGQSMFVAHGSGGDVLTDPYSDGIGYHVPDGAELGVSLVTVSHEHFDHNNSQAFADEAVRRGLTDSGWAEIDEQPLPGRRITTVPSWHDDERGSERGRNAIFVIEMGGMRIVHLGDLGHALTPEQIAAIGPVDVLLVPVGGFFTIDAQGAREVVAQLATRVVIPMHYKTDSSTISQLRPVQPFLAGEKWEAIGSSSVTLNAAELPAPGSAAIWVLEPEGAQ